MIYTMNGCTIRMRAVRGRQIDVMLDESTATQQIIDSIIQTFNAGPYYALRIHTENKNFITYLETSYGFFHEVLWSPDPSKKPPLARGAQCRMPPNCATANTSAGDLVYYDRNYNYYYPVLMGRTQQSNVMYNDPENPYRYFNPLWEVITDDDPYIGCTFPYSVYDYLSKNDFVFTTPNSARVGDDVFDIAVNLATNCISISGPQTLQLSTDHFCVYNSSVNVPDGLGYVDLGGFKILDTIAKSYRTFIFSFKAKHYICIPNIGFLSRVDSLPAGCTPRMTFIGYAKNAAPITILQYYEEAVQK